MGLSHEEKIIILWRQPFWRMVEEIPRRLTDPSPEPSKKGHTNRTAVSGRLNMHSVYR